ncbi:MAG: hypothetical protein QF664_10785 [Dehalococcoidia bacterium]|nr:hypothetical protein [Dehalococcoidia bacterium]
MRRFLVLLVAGIALIVVACGGGGDDEHGLLADRILRLGEDPAAVVDVRAGEIPAGLSEALNPGLAAAAPASEWISLRVHRPDDLVGSFLIERPDGVKSFWLLYDHTEAALTVEQALLRELDESPWQVIAGQSTRMESGIRFQSTMSGDIDGTAIIRTVLGGDAEGGPVTSVVYIVEVRPGRVIDSPDFVLPDPRPVPNAFPADFLLLDGLIPITVLWGSSPAGSTYQMVLLGRDSAFEIVEQYRDALRAEGWELIDDRAVGFATVLEFQKDEGAMLGTLTADTFADDDDYTSVLLELQVASGATN